LDTTSDERINLDGFYATSPATTLDGKAPRKRAGAFSMGKTKRLEKTAIVPIGKAARSPTTSSPGSNCALDLLLQTVRV
jgi:hypothetical protein